ncbi:MAG: type VI secretion system ImpA family N-terminal domain-containing protein, partial [Bosea sp. (in: a-proteobacteria)]
MAALNFVELSKPFVEDGPCGPDLEDDVDFMNVTARLEVALPTAYFRRDDEGRQVAFDRTSIEFPAAFADLGKLMARSQDLRLFVLAAKLSILNRDVGGFVDCLSAMADILGENWDAV